VKLDWQPYGSDKVHHPCSWRAEGASAVWLVLLTPDGRVMFTWWPKDANAGDQRLHHALVNAQVLGQHGMPFPPQAQDRALADARHRAQNRENSIHSGRRTA
jgi:hypothetical protein